MKYERCDKTNGLAGLEIGTNDLDRSSLHNDNNKPKLNFKIEEYHHSFPKLLEFIAHKACRRVQRPLEDGDRHFTIKAKTLQRVKQFAPYGISQIYGAVCVYRFFRNEKPNNPGMAEVIHCRAIWCQRLARALTREYGERDRIGLFTQGLTFRFPKYIWKDGRHVDKITNRLESALEAAVDSHAINFLHEAFVQECIQNIWYGNIALCQEEQQHATKFLSKVSAIPLEVELNSRVVVLRNISSDPQSLRLQVPLYQYLIGAVMHGFLLIALFSYVAFNRSIGMSTTEFFLWICVSAEVLDEVVRLAKFPIRFYFKSLWSWFDVSTLLFLIIVFSLRVSTWVQMDSLGYDEAYWEDAKSVPEIDGVYHFGDVAYNWMAFASIFLWLRLLDVLSSYPFFGNALIIVKRMLKDSVLFFFLLAVVFFGFIQSFEILHRSSFSHTLYMLLRSLLGDPSFEEAQEYHPTLGGILLMMFLFFAVMILLNLLLAVFNDSYSNIVSATSFEFLWQFTWRVVVYLETPQSYPFLMPFNIIAFVVLKPLKYLLGDNKMGNNIVYWSWRVCSLPALAVIVMYEIVKGPPKSLLEANYDSFADLQGFGNPSSPDSQARNRAIKAIYIRGLETDNNKLQVANLFLTACYDSAGADVSRSPAEASGQCLSDSQQLPAHAPRAGALPKREKRAMEKNPVVQVQEFDLEQDGQTSNDEEWDTDSDKDSNLSEAETITSGDGLGKQTMDRLDYIEKLLRTIQLAIEQVNERQTGMSLQSPQ